MKKDDLIKFCLSFPGAQESIHKKAKCLVISNGISNRYFASVFDQNGQLYISLKLAPDKADFLRMVYEDTMRWNKISGNGWIAIPVGGQVSNEELQDLIKESYSLTVPKPKPAPKKSKKIVYAWPENLYRAVFADRFEMLPADAVEAAEHALELLHEREQVVLLGYYKELMKTRELSENYSVSQTRIVAIRNRALRRLRHPTRSVYMLDLAGQLEKDEMKQMYKRVEALEAHSNYEVWKSVSIKHLGLPIRPYNCLNRESRY